MFDVRVCLNLEYFKSIFNWFVFINLLWAEAINQDWERLNFYAKQKEPKELNDQTGTSSQA